MIEKIAFYQERNDEELNIQLAKELVTNEDVNGIDEIVNGLQNRQTQVVNDCIKVLYEIGYRKPQLIEAYVDTFLKTMKSRNNRLVWGSCIALSLIAEKNCHEIYKKLDALMKVYENGSVITRDNCISIFAGMIKGNEEYSKDVLPIIIKHLGTCRPKEVAQHAERASVCLNTNNKKEFKTVLINRCASLSDSQQKRVEKILKRIEEEV